MKVLQRLHKVGRGGDPYFGVDIYIDIKLKPGKVIYAGEPNPTGYLTTKTAIDRIGNYANWSNYKAKLIKENQDCFIKSILGEPDNIRPGAIEYSLDWATITSYEDPKSGDSAINI